ncbi:MAG: hypothetical protein ACOY3V_02210 [Pseudomonadota bacterium]
MKRIIQFISLFLNLIWAEQSSALQAGEGILLDPVTGNYLLNYRSEFDGSLIQKDYIPSTKIDPSLISSTKLIDGWNVLYQYNLANGSSAKQPIVNLDIYGLPTNVNISGATTISVTDQLQNYQLDSFESALIVPINSDCSGSGTRTSEETNIGWLCVHYLPQSDIPDPLSGIPPGTTLKGFGLISSYLPGLITAQVAGDGDGRIGLGDEASSEFMDLYESQLLNVDYVLRNAAAPVIAVLSPFDAAVTLERVRDHTHTWIDQHLLEAAFSAQLDPLFQQAIDAYRAGLRETGKKHLESLRDLVKQQQPDAESQGAAARAIAMPPAKLDLLAARVLFFDVNYVMERGSR